MTKQRLTYAEHLAFYQRQQSFRKRKQLELTGHPTEAPTSVRPRATTKRTATAATPATAATTRIPVASPVDRTVRLRLRVAAGPGAGHVFDLTEGEYVIGRSDDANIQLHSATVSHHHAKIVVTSGRTTIQDLGSLNGSKLGDVSLRGTALLSPGDRIFLGVIELSVEAGDQRA
jgi:pSer/pThr/pTyr-binding forkhead associated (FHA) protein